MFMSRDKVAYYKNEYPKGTRIQLDDMQNDPHPIETGTKGTVDFVDDIGTLFVRFDNGRYLGVCPDADKFHKI